MIMNRKSYLKGFGLGVVITCLILMIAFKFNTNTVSDDEVIKRAKELGYVEANTLVSNVSSPSPEPADNDLLNDDENINNEQDAAVEDNDGNNDTGKDNLITDSGNNEEVNNNEYGSEEKKTDSQNESQENETKKDETEEEVKNENETDSSVESGSEITEEIKDEGKENDEEISQFIVVEIRSGESSETVSSKVKDAGLVENASNFNKYLCQNGYDKIMRVGKYEIPADATEEEIAKILSGKN